MSYVSKLFRIIGEICNDKDCELVYRILMNLARMIGARLRKADEETVKLTTAMSIILQES